MHRFFIEPAKWDPEALVLDETEAHHARSVLRLDVGDKLVAFDGQGTEATAEVLSLDGGTAALKTLTLTQTEPLACRVVLGQAVPKGKNMDLVVQKATELGVAQIVPVLSSRTVVSLDADDAAKKQQKWQQTAVGACKQSGQNWLPGVAAPVAIDRFLASPPQADLVLIASLQPGARHLKAILAEYAELHGGDRDCRFLLVLVHDPALCLCLTITSS